MEAINQDINQYAITWGLEDEDRRLKQMYADVKRLRKLCGEENFKL